LDGSFNFQPIADDPLIKQKALSFILTMLGDDGGLELVEGFRLYEELTNRQPQPFNWKFTKYDLFNLLQRLARKSQAEARPTGSTKARDVGEPYSYLRYEPLRRFPCGHHTQGAQGLL
jgi:hypothetical protein